MSDIIHDISGLLVLGTDMTLSRRKEIGPLIGDVNLPFPIVIIDNFIFSAYVDCVGNDNLYGAKSAISYLIDRGHRRFGYLRAKQRITNFDDRENGIRMALAEHLGSYEPLEIIDVDIAADKAYQDICRWLDGQTSLPDALFAENDVVAAAAIRAFNTHGIRVPEEISVMGFDNIPVCEMVEPTITDCAFLQRKAGHRGGQSSAQADPKRRECSGRPGFRHHEAVHVHPHCDAKKRGLQACVDRKRAVVGLPPYKILSARVEPVKRRAHLKPVLSPRCPQNPFFCEQILSIL